MKRKIDVMPEPPQAYSVGFVSLGCPKNVVDSEKMLAHIAQAGMVISENAFEADAVVINTCGFIAPAKAEAISVIEEAMAWKRRGLVKKIIVAGCLAQRMNQDLFKETEGIDTIVGLAHRDQIANIIKQTMTTKQKMAFLGEPLNEPPKDNIRLLTGTKHWAYLRISEGCDHKCSFCTIPSIRGKFHSKPIEQILGEATELTDAGVVELNIIGQDTSCYGRDLGIKEGLAKLIEKLNDINKTQWIRLMYLYPTGISERLINTIAENSKIINYLDIPLQHINDEILSSMRRPDKSKQIRSLIEKLRKNISGIVLRTTFIVGFPRETDKQFEELLEFVKWAKFDAMGCFKYYPEKGTTAAELPNQIPEKIKKQRLEQLMLAQQEIAFEKNKNRKGSILKILVDTVTEDGRAEGRFYGQAPEIDSLCIINKNSSKTGQFIKAKVTGWHEYDLIVEQNGLPAGKI
ncbi:MAG: 30S ribosomal protein S12 methylthiotransferase RimO [Phycisphaerae bacterium]